MKVSALILTLNEELNLRRCLESLKWCDDILVLDSYSKDKTEEIARSFGARFVQRKFDNYAAQRNFGLEEIEYKNPWVLMVDADEIWPYELAREIDTEIGWSDNNICLYSFRRKDFFMGKWLRRSSGYPTWTGRLVKLGHVRVKRSINEEYYTEGSVGFIKGHFFHYPFNKGFAAWIDKHNRYSDMEAGLIFRKAERINWRNLISKDPTVRRRSIKTMVYKMPGRPFIMFFVLYFFRGGFVDGRAGLIYCFLRSFYEFMISCKVIEYRLRQKGLPL